MLVRDVEKSFVSEARPPMTIEGVAAGIDVVVSPSGDQHSLQNTYARRDCPICQVQSCFREFGVMCRSRSQIGVRTTVPGVTLVVICSKQSYRYNLKDEKRDVRFC